MSASGATGADRPENWTAEDENAAMALMQISDESTTILASAPSAPIHPNPEGPILGIVNRIAPLQPPRLTVGFNEGSRHLKLRITVRPGYPLLHYYPIWLRLPVTAGGLGAGIQVGDQMICAIQLLAIYEEGKEHPVWRISPEHRSCNHLGISGTTIRLLGGYMMHHLRDFAGENRIPNDGDPADRGWTYVWHANLVKRGRVGS